MRDLTKRFGGLAAVAGLSFDIRAGELLGVIGPNGAGKTTLFHLVTGFHRPSSGEVRFEGRTITGLRPHAVCRLGIARTFQIVQPFPGLTVLANAMIGAFNRTREPAAAEAAARSVLGVVGLSAKAGHEARTLTLSERKRLEVARALATGPRVLLLDEVMAGLTAAEVHDAVELVKRIQARGVACVVVEHVMEGIMPIADQILVLDYGRKIAQGTPTQVRNDPAVIAAYLGES